MTGGKVWKKLRRKKRVNRICRRNERKDGLSEMRKYTEDERFMKEAIRQAKKAEAIGDVPIGCVIVCDGKIIARGYNKRNKNKTVLAHAELLAMSKACKKTGDWRLEDCTMYITLEPCQMCAGARRAGADTAAWSSEA